MLALLCGSILAPAQHPDTLPVDSGLSGFKEELRRLQTTARLMHTTAHPDDEDGGMLTLESRGHGVEALLFTLTRGEGGQNRTGSNLFDELGVLRTLELLESDRYYGVEQRFSRVADFGYSKNAQETFQQWHGHEVPLADLVRAIRTFRPDVLISRFQGASRDGHGHHEASGVLSREAFRAAADPNRFPEQLREGLTPWQVKKLYVDNVRAGEDYAVRFETTVDDPLLGTSYAQFAIQGLRHQLSQGAGQWNFPSGPRYSTYKLVDSVLPVTADAAGHEPSFFAGIDTTLPGLAARVAAGPIPQLRARLAEIERLIKDAAASAERPADAVLPLVRGHELTTRLIEDVRRTAYAPADKAELLAQLTTKQAQLERAAGLALGLSFQAVATVQRGEPAGPADAILAAGDYVMVTASLKNGGSTALEVRSIEPELPQGWRWEPLQQLRKELPAGATMQAGFRIAIPADAPLTRPRFRRSDPHTETLYAIPNDGIDPGRPFTPPPIRFRAEYALAGDSAPIHSVATMREAGQAADIPVAIGPPVSILLEPASLLLRVGSGQPATVSVAVTSYRQTPNETVVRLELPAGWQASPASIPLTFAGRGDRKTATFTVRPGALAERHYAIRAVAVTGGARYEEGLTIVSREDLGTFYYFQRAAQDASAVAVQVPAALKVGYVMGAGDDIPTALQQIGLNVHLLSPEELAGGDLRQFDTIVLGIRAYDTRADVKANNRRLLEYVQNGGTLLVQYNAATSDFNSSNLTPYPAQLGRERVSVEEAPVRILDPAHPIFRYPNQITPRDFAGWVQERGLYFMQQWDRRYNPLLASGDPGEAPLYGGLLVAPYGKGTYIYTGYAFFRQIPAGVPGAIRLFVNLLAAGHDGSASQTSNQSPRP